MYRGGWLNGFDLKKNGMLEQSNVRVSGRWWNPYAQKPLRCIFAVFKANNYECLKRMLAVGRKQEIMVLEAQD